jgi:hypothetical protein
VRRPLRTHAARSKVGSRLVGGKSPLLRPLANQDFCALILADRQPGPDAGVPT